MLRGEGFQKAALMDSWAYVKRFMMRLDKPTRAMLERLSRHFKRSSAETIRQLVAQATPEDFPPSWQLAVQECQASHARRHGLGTREETTS
jgi:mannosyltransferase OCH1-like enzyme